MFFKNLLTSGYSFTKNEYELQLKYILFNSLLIFNIIAVTITGIIRFMNLQYTIVAIDIIYLLSALTAFFLARHAKQYFPNLVLFVLIISFFIVSLIFYNDFNPIIGLGWFTVLFMTAIFLSEKKEVLTGVILLSLVSIFYISLTKYNYTIIEITLGTVPFIVSVFFMYFFQKRNQNLKQQLQNLNQTLQKTNHQLNAKVKDTNHELLKLQQILDKSPVSVVITDIDGNIEYANPSFTRVTGYTMEESIGQNPKVLKSDIHSDEYYAKLWDDITHNKVWNGTFKNISKSGKEYWESAIIAPVNNENGELSNFMAIKQEITQQVYLEDKLFKQDKEKIENFEKTLESFVGMVEQRDTYTAGHSNRMADYAKLIALEMGYSQEECELLYRASILHDIGKIATPDNVLLKPGKLSKLEYKLIQEHVVASYDILAKIPMYKDLADIIISHHERYDGKGYPHGLKEDEIHPLAQIMIVADAFDAMTTNRIYKGRKSIAEAIEELKECSASQFHPIVVEHAVKALRNIEIHDTVNQLPKTDLEKERFSYFYRDQVTHVYNGEYLTFILNQNKFNKEYACVNTLYMHNFHQYNKKYGWNEGNKLLNKFAEYLITHFESALIFKIYGNDFVILNQEHVDMDIKQFNELELLKENNITITNYHRNLDKNDSIDLEILCKN